MIKKLILTLCVITVVFSGLAGCDKKAGNPGKGEVELFSKEDTDKATKDNTDAYINGKKADENMVKDITNSLKDNAPKGLPKGFPQSVPFYKNAQIIEADTYGSDGYTVVYTVKEAYKKVVDFYIDNIEGLDKSGIGEEEAYFEGMDIGDVHINGLTIEEAGENTQVFITLRNYGTASSDNEGSGDEEGESDDAETIKYDTAQQVTLKKGYPDNIVPIYPKAKVIESSVSPSGDIVHTELVLPPKSYNDAVKFYKKELSLESKASESEMMASETFEGTVEGWKVKVWIVNFKQGGNDPSMSITINR